MSPGASEGAMPLAERILVALQAHGHLSTRRIQSLLNEDYALPRVSKHDVNVALYKRRDLFHVRRSILGPPVWFVLPGNATPVAASLPERLELIQPRESALSAPAIQPISDDEARLIEERRSARQLELAKAGVNLKAGPVIHIDHPAALVSDATKGAFGKEITKHIDGEPG